MVFKKEDNMLHKNQFVSFTALGFVVFCLVLAGCAMKKPMWGDPETGFILKYNITQDQVLNYKSVADSIETTNMMGQSIEASTKFNMDYNIKGTGADDQDNLLTQVTINDFGINISSSMQGEIAPDTSGLKGKSFGVSFSPIGDEIEFIGIDDLPKIDFGQMSGGEQNVSRYFLDILPNLSDDPIKVGGTWSYQKEYNIEQGPLGITMKVESTNILEGLETVKGMECVRIKTQGKGTVEGSGNVMGTELKIKGDVDSTATWYFAYKKGLFVKVSGEEDVDLIIEAGTMGDIPQVSKVKVETGLVL
jgi:hypothetical protein